MSLRSNMKSSRSSNGGPRPDESTRVQNKIRKKNPSPSLASPSGPFPRVRIDGVASSPHKPLRPSFATRVAQMGGDMNRVEPVSQHSPTSPHESSRQRWPTKFNRSSLPGGEGVPDLPPLSPSYRNLNKTMFPSMPPTAWRQSDIPHYVYVTEAAPSPVLSHENETSKNSPSEDGTAVSARPSSELLHPGEWVSHRSKPPSIELHEDRTKSGSFSRDPQDSTIDSDIIDLDEHGPEDRVSRFQEQITPAASFERIRPVKVDPSAGKPDPPSTVEVSHLKTGHENLPDQGHETTPLQELNYHKNSEKASQEGLKVDQGATALKTVANPTQAADSGGLGGVLTPNLGMDSGATLDYHAILAIRDKPQAQEVASPTLLKALGEIPSESSSNAQGDITGEKIIDPESLSPVAGPPDMTNSVKVPTESAAPKNLCDPLPLEKTVGAGSIPGGQRDLKTFGSNSEGRRSQRPAAIDTALTKTPPIESAQVLTPPHSNGSSRRTSSASSLSRSSINGSAAISIQLLPEQPRHPLSISQLPPPSPSSTPDIDARRSDVLSEEATQRSRNRLKKRRLSTSSQSSSVSASSGIQNFFRRSSSSDIGEGPKTSNQKSPRFSGFLSTPPSSYRHFGSTGKKRSESSADDASGSASESESSIRKGKSRVSRLFSRSTKSSTALQQPQERPGRDGLSTAKPPAVETKPNFLPLGQSPVASRDNSPLRQAIAQDLPTAFTFRPPRPVRTNSPASPRLFSDRPIIQGVSAIPIVGRNPSPNRVAPVLPPAAGVGNVSAPAATRRYTPGHQMVSIADLQAFNNSGGEVVIFRRFDAVHRRVLLDMQDKIVTLEAELHRLDEMLKASKDNGKQPNTGQLGPDGEIAQAKVKRQKVLVAIKGTLNDYDDLLLKFDSLRVAPSDQRSAINKFKVWLQKNGSKYNVASSPATVSSPQRILGSALGSPRSIPASGSNRSLVLSGSMSSIVSGTISNELKEEDEGNEQVTSSSSLPASQATPSIDPELRDAAAAIMNGQNSIKGKEKQNSGLKSSTSSKKSRFRNSIR